MVICMISNTDVFVINICIQTRVGVVNFFGMYTVLKTYRKVTHLLYNTHVEYIFPSRRTITLM